MTVTRELPRYQCHKQVWALKIRTIIQTPSGFELHFEDERYAPDLVTQEWVVRFAPMSGGYLVVYEDGYRSFSPAEAFEAGYSLVEAGVLADRVAALADDFDLSQWWVRELEAAVAEGTDNQKRAVAVVRNLLQRLKLFRT